MNHAIEKFRPKLDASFTNVKYSGSYANIDGKIALLISTDPSKPKSRNMLFQYYDNSYNLILDVKLKGVDIILYNIPQRDKIYIINVVMLKEYLNHLAKKYPVENASWPNWFTSSVYSLVVNPDILEKASYCEALPGDTMNIKNEVEKICNYC